MPQSSRTQIATGANGDELNPSPFRSKSYDHIARIWPDRRVDRHGIAHCCAYRFHSSAFPTMVSRCRDCVHDTHRGRDDSHRAIDLRFGPVNPARCEFTRARGRDSLQAVVGGQAADFDRLVPRRRRAGERSLRAPVNIAKKKLPTGGWCGSIASSRGTPRQGMKKSEIGERELAGGTRSVQLDSPPIGQCNASYRLRKKWTIVSRSPCSARMHSRSGEPSRY